MAYYMVSSAAQFIDFAKEAFGAEILDVTHLREGSEAIVHGEMKIGDSTLLFADASPEKIACGEECQNPDEPSTVQLWVYVENAEDTVKKTVELGATVIQEVEKQEDGDFGGIIDPFGNLWWIKSVR